MSSFDPGGPTNPFGTDPFNIVPPHGAPDPRVPTASRETNTLATLSVVFAFVFAPAGAILGHLGLAQIGRTGQPGRGRALVGVTLSYALITVAVVALAVWAVTGAPTVPPTVASPPTTATAASTSSTPTPTTSPPVPSVSVGPGPTLTVLAPAGSLLDVEEMKAVLGTPVNKYAPASVPVDDLAAYPQLDTVETLPGTQGTVSDTGCAAMVFAGTPAPYQDTGYQAIHQVTMAQPGPNGTQSVTETAVAFATPAAANDALTGYLRSLEPCKGKTTTVTLAGTGKAYPLELSASGPKEYTFAGGDQQKFWGFENSEENDGSPRKKRDDLFTVERNLAVRGNVLIDISVRGLRFDVAFSGVLSGIVDKS